MGSIVVVSNRGPFRVSGTGARRKRVRAAGGLVTALLPVLRERGGTWVSAQETDHPLVVADQGESEPFDVAEVKIPKRQRDAFYGPFSNGVLWPLLHSMKATVPLGAAPWDAYDAANHAFAEVALKAGGSEGTYWVHDYHLMRVPGILRERAPGSRIGWFCHIPWPGPDLFSALPWRSEMLDGLLGADLLGFHTEEYAEQFLACIRRLTDHPVRGETIDVGERRVKVVVAPIGVPWDELQSLARSPGVERERSRIRRRIDHRAMILGVDRLDYTKGVPERLEAWARLLAKRPKLREGAVLVQVMVPSREAVKAYQDLKDEVDRLVGDINGRFALTGRVPLHYFYRSLNPEQLYAHYRAADVGLVTPLRDGMNLVAHEYCGSRVEEDGVLVLSEFAGAAHYLRSATIVNPHDVVGTAEALEEALRRPRLEQREPMQELRKQVAALDVHKWAAGYLGRLEG
ncbi:MAG: trehalose-6-phosphate synthase [Myxococcota bacterium]